MVMRLGVNQQAIHVGYRRVFTARSGTVCDPLYPQPARDGGGIFNSAGTVNVKNTIVAGNSASSSGPDCSGTPTSQGYNLIGDDTDCSFTPDTGDLVGTGASPIDPLLDALADNGGPTQTHALDPNSPAIDAGNPATPGSGGNACEATDQRGVARPVGPRCDIGAFEFEAPPPVVLCNGQPATVVGSPAADMLVGSSGDDVIAGLGGDDVILGLSGNDTICGGPGEDFMDGGPGQDRLFGQGGDDFMKGGPGPDRAFGGKGDDILRGNRGNDRLFGNSQNDVLVGGRGNDLLVGGPGDDVALGRAHDDTIKCGGGVDYADGGTGIDANPTADCEGTVNIP